jgi:hypothetical protein
MNDFERGEARPAPCPGRILAVLMNQKTKCEEKPPNSTTGRTGKTKTEEKYGYA